MDGNGVPGWGHNLDNAGVIDLKEMKKVGSTDQVNVIAQFDRQGKDIATNRYYCKNGAWS